MQNVELPSQLAGDAGLETRLRRLQLLRNDRDVSIDFANVSFVRPSGLAHVFVATFTLLSQGRKVTIRQALSPAVQRYMRRANFWNTLRECGANVPDAWIGDVGPRSDSLIECSMIHSLTDLHELQSQNGQLVDRFRGALSAIGVRSPNSAQLWSELCANAAEHSRSAYGAFVMAQAYARRDPPAREIEIAIADVGRGVFDSLRHLDKYSDERSAVAGSLEWGVTGRRDAGGHPMDGGTGLFTARCDADRMMLRSGSAMARNVTGERHSGEPHPAPLRMTLEECYPMVGTIVTALVLAPDNSQGSAL